MTVAQYNREQGVERANVVANPQFSAFEPGSDFAESTLFVDGMIGRFSDFNDLFVTNPDLAERGIGLQPDAFADFHFNKAE